MTEQRVALASGSPRRKELLARMGVSFVVDAADVDERCEGSPAEVVMEVARRKARAVAPRHPDKIVLAADTVVYLGGVMGKPKDTGDAARMLRRLSDNWHEVYTGVCVLAAGHEHCGAEMTRVHFTRMAEEDIRGYIATGEPMDKAGAYAIQGAAGMFIDRVEGCPHNVIGLPLALTRRFLAAAGLW